MHFTPPTAPLADTSTSWWARSVSSTVVAAFLLIVILLPEPAYITEYIDDPFDTVLIAGESANTTINHFVSLVFFINTILIVVIF